MSLVSIGAGFIWAMVFVYAILGAIDFGSSFWRWRFSLARDWEAEEIAHVFVSPTWELVNSFLALLPVALVGLFPGAAYAYGNILLIPASLVLALLILRGAYWQFGYASQKRNNRIVWLVGLTGLALPGLFTTILAISQGGYVLSSNGSYLLQVGRFLHSPGAIFYFIFGLAMALYLSALFLAQYAHQADRVEAYTGFRKSALQVGPISLISGFLALVTSVHGQLNMTARLISWWPLLAVSLIAFLLGYLHLLIGAKSKSPTLSLWATIGQLVFAHVAYGVAHYPYALYPYLTFADAASNHSMFVTTLVVFIAGFLLLVPGFVLFRKLFIVDSKYMVNHSAK